MLKPATPAPNCGTEMIETIFTVEIQRDLQRGMPSLMDGNGTGLGRGPSLRRFYAARNVAHQVELLAEIGVQPEDSMREALRFCAQGHGSGTLMFRALLAPGCSG